MKQTIIFLRNLVILGTLLCIFAHFVRNATLNNSGKFNQLIVLFSKIPKKVVSVVQQTSKKHSTTFKIDGEKELVNELDYDLYVINSKMERNENFWKAQLRNLKNDSLIHEWQFYNKDYFKGNSANGARLFRSAYPISPLLLEDRSLIVFFNESFNLMRVDKASNIIWKNNEREYHHTMNLDPDGNLWVCSRNKGNVAIKPSNESINYIDDAITKINISTGETVFHKSLSEILIDNHYAGLLYGSKNNTNELNPNDPMHLNDIQPAFIDSPYWKKGDLFISIRNRSTIIQYRPATNKIIRLIQGPFIAQHDVDFIDEETIAVFNNNVPIKTDKEMDTNQNNRYYISTSSEVNTYHFKDSTWNSLYKNVFEQERIYTEIQGGYTILSNGDLFVECNQTEQIFIFNENQLKFKGYANQPNDSYVPEALWMRVYENINF